MQQQQRMVPARLLLLLLLLLLMVRRGSCLRRERQCKAWRDQVQLVVAFDTTSKSSLNIICLG
jgi:hypothetical protein